MSSRATYTTPYSRPEFLRKFQNLLRDQLPGHPAPFAESIDNLTLVALVVNEALRVDSSKYHFVYRFLARKAHEDPELRILIEEIVTSKAGVEKLGDVFGLIYVKEAFAELGKRKA